MDSLWLTVLKKFVLGEVIVVVTSVVLALVFPKLHWYTVYAVWIALFFPRFILASLLLLISAKKRQQFVKINGNLKGGFLVHGLPTFAVLVIVQVFFKWALLHWLGYQVMSLK